MAKSDDDQKVEHGKLYQDQLHGAQVLSPLAVAVMDTPEFQRLAGLKQLGFADLVYRGAQHTRFSHSVGTHFLSRTIMRRIVQNHERLGLGHPGAGLPPCFSMYPYNAYAQVDIDKCLRKCKRFPVSHQSKWRGLTEVVSIAALLHDIGHVPYGHTLEDEFAGIFERHDRVAGPRLYELLFNEQSQIRRIFGDEYDPWIRGIGNKTGIPNIELLRLVYVILSWKEDVEQPAGFKAILDRQKAKLKATDSQRRQRLENLESWYDDFSDRGMFQPFISDIIGNTICADLLDYLPRDRMNLGMEVRTHDRLQRYLTIRDGTLYKNEGKRVSIMVTRRYRGGQRRDVATAVLDIMRERYEMAERVYYHHKKAAASAMLAKLVELAPDVKPTDDSPIYPAPWTGDTKPKHMVHFTDTTFVDYVGTAETSPEARALQRRLYVGIRYDRRAIYRTLLVVDSDVVQMSARPCAFFAAELRKGKDGRPGNEGRQELENDLARTAGVSSGEIIIYCPSPDMQAKEVDARLEIIHGRILPLRVQRESFAYHADIKVLEQYYQQLWLIYVLVSPDLYENAAKCKAIVDRFCERYGVEPMVAYKKVRGFKFRIEHDVIAERALEPLEKFFKGDGEEGLTFSDTPATVIASVIAQAAKDQLYLEAIKNDSESSVRTARIAALFDASILEEAYRTGGAKKVQLLAYQHYQKALISSARSSAFVLQAALASHEKIGDRFDSFAAYREHVLKDVTDSGDKDTVDES